MTSIKALFGRARQLGLAEDDLRDVARQITGSDSLRGHNRETYEVILQRMGPAPRRTSLSSPYLTKARALWIAGYNLGLVRDKRDAALYTFIKRQTGLDHGTWLSHERDGKRVVEALKGWLARDGGVDWSRETTRPTAMNNPRFQVAIAIYQRLQVAANMRDESPFDGLMRFIDGHVGPLSLAQITPGQWIIVQNALGERLRDVRAGLGSAAIRRAS
ncbi:regulatory protein GemA [Polycladidibacter hongkongensis]|uniref:regulatory protein GemA n=1 Tax=Polycladidibacter hongkongensis TaxID=1647556 RepID=UPI00082E40F5|nr:regulatory protein GemA [Pseudovibrio hongkongensis]